MSDFNFAPDRWEFWRELPDPDDSQYGCLDEHEDEEEESEDELQRVELERVKRR